MNKTQTRKHITKLFCEFINANYLHYVIDEGEGGRLDIVNTKFKHSNNNIEYSRLHHECVCLNWSSSETNQHTDEMNAYLKKLKHEYETT